MLSAAPHPIRFKNQSEIEIINVQRSSKLVRFGMGKFGDVDICYEGWTPIGFPQTLRVSIVTYGS